MKLVKEIGDEDRGALRPSPDREPTRKEIWRFYEFLRSTNKTNMMHAPSYAEYYLDMDKELATKEFFNWIEQPAKEEKLKNLLRSK